MEKLLDFSTNLFQGSLCKRSLCCVCHKLVNDSYTEGKPVQIITSQYMITLIDVALFYVKLSINIGLLLFVHSECWLNSRLIMHFFTGVHRKLPLCKWIVNDQN